MESSLFIVDAVAIYLFSLRLLLFVVATLMLLSSLDDFIIDVIFVCRALYRRLVIYRRYQPLKEEQLLTPPEQPIAIMVPAWDEAAVIQQMLTTTCQLYTYQNYRLFVGIYPNDQNTLDAARRAQQRFPQVEIIICKAPGPTNKADCLNMIYRGIQEYEQHHNMTFAIFVMHDAEDVVHPLELKLYNYLIPRKDMIQIPVVPLESPLHDLTAGHYMDEFAEHHSKDLVVQEALTGNVPSAGVGSAFSRRALTVLSGPGGHPPFNTSSLTEDYDIGLRLKREGLKQIFVRFAVWRQVIKKSRWTGRLRPQRQRDLIATREYFPNTLDTAKRQKARWLLGIVFQGWAEQGWAGSWPLKFILYRDRKGLLSAQLNMLGYFIVINVLLLWIYYALWPDGYRFAPLVESGEVLWSLLLINLFFMLNRLIHRSIYVGRLYGLAHALISPFRQIWGNVINFAASLRALKLFWAHVLRGDPISWDKTHHAFPEGEALQPFRKRLGVYLLENNDITPAVLQEALDLQATSQTPLGQILIKLGYLAPERLEAALQQQKGDST